MGPSETNWIRTVLVSSGMTSEGEGSSLRLMGGVFWSLSSLWTFTCVQINNPDARLNALKTNQHQLQDKVSAREAFSQLS